MQVKKLMTTISASAAVLILFAATVSAMDLGGVDIHGFVSQGFVKTTKENNFPVTNSGQGSFNFNDFGINFAKALTDDLHVGMQLFAFDRGSYGKDKITLDWAFGDYRFKDWLGIRVGKVKIPLGLYNEARDNDALRTFVFLPQQAYYDYERDSLVAILGAGVYGSISLGSAGTFNYQLETGTIPAVADGGFAQEIGGMISTTNAALSLTSISSKTSIAHSLEWRTPVPGLRALVTGLHTTLSGTANGINIDTDGTATADWKYDSLHRYLFSLEYTFKDLVLSSEYELDDYTLSANYSDPALEAFSSRQESDAWCFMATYRFTDWFEFGSFHHEVYADRHHRDGSTFADFGMFAPYNMWWKDSALTLRFDPLPDVVFKLEGHKINGTYEIIENFENAKRDWYMFATKATITF
jgi:hypothetical protein